MALRLRLLTRPACTARLSRALFLVLAVLLASSRPIAAQEATLYRVFLNDGTALVSYGEFSRVEGQVVLNIPIDAAAEPPRLQLVTVPATAVDWRRTEEYAESARYAHYVANRAETDFAAMTAQIAAALNRIGLVRDPAERLRVAEEARRELVTWPAVNYGYRAGEVREMVGLLDEIISDLRAAAGLQAFELSLVATTTPPPRVPMLPAPSTRETIDNALAVARITESPAERLSLLQSVFALLEAPTVPLPSGWVRATRDRVAAQIRAEARIDAAYTELTRAMFRQVQEKATAGDVRGIEAVLRAVTVRDEELGRRRPAAVSALVDAIEAKLVESRRLRLLEDRRALEESAIARYRQLTDGTLADLAAMRSWLDDIKTLAGPDQETLTGLAERLASVGNRLRDARPPVEFEPLQRLVVSAWQLAETAASGRLAAVASGDLRRAWDASSAAAAAMMLLERAQEEFDRTLTVPNRP